MKNTKMKLVFSGCLLALLLFSFGTAFLVTQAGYETNDVFSNRDQSKAVKFRTAYCDMRTSAEKGLLVYGYDNGATVDLKSPVYGIFNTKFKIIAPENKPAPLKTLTFGFTDKSGGKFSVVIQSKTSGSQVFVETDKRGGIYYCESDGQTYGYTGLYNKNGIYTRVPGNSVLHIEFDPAAMTVKVGSEGGSVRTVWDFSKPLNDGRKLSVLRPFSGYTVSLSLTEIAGGNKGEVLFYTFAGQKLDKRFQDASPSMFVDMRKNAVVNKECVLPAPVVFDKFAGEIKNPAVKVSVYDDQGNLISSDYRFIPGKSGTYYCYYNYENLCSQFLAIEAIDAGAVSKEYFFENAAGDVLRDDTKIGIHSALTIPKCFVKSNIIYGKDSLPMKVRLLKGREELGNYDEGGFSYKFNETGEYKAQYYLSDFPEFACEKPITVSPDVLGISLEKAEPVYLPDEVAELKNAYFYKNGREEICEPCVTFPSGKIIRGKSIRLDEMGIYTVSYVYSGGICSYDFTVKELYDNMFTASGTSYAKNKAMEANESVKGQMLTLGNNSPVVYDKVIDLSDNRFDDTLADRSENQPFIEMIVQPAVPGKIDMTALYVRLTDKYDPDNFMEVRIKYLDYLPNDLRIRAQCTGQSWGGTYYNWLTGEPEFDHALTHEDGGFTIHSSFNQDCNTRRNLREDCIKLYYDDATKGLYSVCWIPVSNDGKNTPVSWLIRDFDDASPAMSGGDKPWRGFTTGEVYLSIYAKGVSNTADVMLLSVDGEQLSDGYVNDSVPPEIIIDKRYEKETPKAETGTSYKLFDYEARDLFSAACKQAPAVYYEGDLSQRIEIKDNSFVPDKAGKYTIVYSAKDGFKNSAQKEIEVQAFNYLDELKLDIGWNIPESVSLGKEIHLPVCSCSGGAGGYKTDITVKRQGETMDIRYGSFLCDKAGKYVVTYKLEDYLGKTRYRQFIIMAEESDEYLSDGNNIVLPEEFIQGDKFYFDYFDGVKYTKEGKFEQTVEIEVTDGGGKRTIKQGEPYIPQASGGVSEATVSYKLDGKTKHVFVRPIRTVVQGLGFLKNYFSYKNAQCESQSSGTLFSAESGNTEISFLRPISVKHLDFILQMNRNFADYSSMDIILQGKHNADERVTLKVCRDGGYYSVGACGRENALSVSEDEKIAFKFDPGGMVFTDIYEKICARPDCFDSGRPFLGWTGGEIYLTVRINGIRSKTTLGINSISNQILNNNRRDNNGPLITVNGKFDGTYLKGDTVVIRTAQAYDVLNPVGDVTVSVSHEGKIIRESTSANKEFAFVADEYGKYSIVYAARDSKGNEAEYSCYIAVCDNTRPVLILDGDIPESMRTGETLRLPSYTVRDGEDSASVITEIYAVSPDGEINDIKKNQIVTDRKGKWVIYYLLKDANDNISAYSYRIDVIEEG